MKMPLSALDGNIMGQASSLFVKNRTSQFTFEQNDPLPEIGGELTPASYGEAVADDNTILIQRTIRSGQSICFEGNVVVMGDVNPGGEIIAGGNIVVMGHLRGVVHAGALGNEKAVVAAFRLQPTQLRIANHITRAPDEEEITPEQPEIAKIQNGVVVIEKYYSNGSRHLNHF